MRLLRRIRLPRGLAARVTLVAVLAVGAGLGVAGAAVVIASERADRDALDHDLTDLAGRLERSAERAYGGHDYGGAAGESQRPAQRPPLDPGGDRFTRLTWPGGGRSEGLDVPAGFPAGAEGGFDTVEAGGERWRTTARTLDNGARLQVAARLEPLEARTARLRRIVIAALLVSLAATALATRAVVRLVLRPLGELRGAAARVASTADLGVRVPRHEGPEEVDALAGDFNAMLARLERAAGERETALSSARRFAADAGHELRTPLTSLRANLASLERSGLDDDARAAILACQDDGRRLATLVEQLQALARGEAGPPRAAETVDLGELADSALASLRVRHPGVNASLEGPESGPVLTADADGLRTLLDNLLENAAVHAGPDSRVLVRVASYDGAGAELVVEDDGPGVPGAERTRVLERFARGDGARGPGTGLGLAIAAAQAGRHGGELTLDDSPLGGLRARTRLLSA